MSSMQQSLKADQSEGQTQAKTEELIASWEEAADTAKDNTSDTTQSTKESAREAKHETSSFLQQTGEQMVQMAQSAVDSVKNTLGMNDKKN